MNQNPDNDGKETVHKSKANAISKMEVWLAYKQVKSNRGAGGVDGQSLADFEVNLENNLYKIWNRMASGSYMPPPVLEVTIPKKDGGSRTLGIPTVSDRIAQMVVKNRIEPRLETVFHPNSYGYRPGKSAHDALAITRKRCWKYDWVIDLDIKAFFDNIDHELLLKAVTHHVDEKWIISYVKRWLTAPLQKQDTGEQIERTRGTPQGGVISPLLANLLLHYVFDHWMKTHHPGAPFARYADDAVVHCQSEANARELLEEIKQRFAECGLQIHPEKTKVVYCKDDGRQGEYKETKFKFLSYEFRARGAWSSKYKMLFIGFLPAISRDSILWLREEIRSWEWQSQVHLNLEDLAKQVNAMIRGWINYYGRFYVSQFNREVLRYLNDRLVIWAAQKYKRFKKSKRRARKWLQQIYLREPDLWAHWSHGIGMYG